jgi:uncharacterized phage infection (PIP) family protein YhgE
MNEKVFKEKIQLLKKLYGNYIRQADLINENKLEELNEALEKQNSIIEGLKRLDEISGTLEDNNPINLEINSILKEIEKIQNNIINTIKNKENELSGKFKQINIGRKAIYGGYIKPEPMNNGYFIDKKIGR